MREMMDMDYEVDGGDIDWVVLAIDEAERVPLTGPVDVRWTRGGA